VLVIFTDTRSEIGILNVTDDIRNPHNPNRAIVKNPITIQAMKSGSITTDSVLKITD